jgi:NAD+ kinase
MSHADPRVQRSILVVAHAHRNETVIAAERVVNALRAAGARPVLAADDRDELAAVRPAFADVATLDDVPLDDIELAIVLGGDGTILRAAEIVRDGTAPVLGINMGHVGFLAEIERDDMDDAVRRAIDRDYVVEERLALQVRV